MTWTGLRTGTLADLSVVQELGPDTLIVGGECAVQESTNGGASFSPLALGSSADCSSEVSAVSFQSAARGFVELQSGRVLYTADRGRTTQVRTRIPLPTADSDAKGLQFISPTEGFAVTGDDSPGTIQRTTDAAHSWTRVAGSPNGLNGLTFVSPEMGYAVGDDDTLLRTLDGGATWTRLPLVLPPGARMLDLEHISCSGALDCLISTDPEESGAVVRTADGGLSGSIVSVPGRLLQNVAFSSRTSAVGVGL